jgi:hypothetical protein
MNCYYFRSYTILSLTSKPQLMKTIKLLVAPLVLSLIAFSFTNTEEWFLVKTQNCKIYFPKKPTDKSESVNTAKGDLKVNIYFYQAAENDNDDNLAYILSETEYPDSVMNSDKTDKLESFFRNSIDGAVSNFKGKLLDESEINIDGFPGRKVRIDLKNGKTVMNMRFYLVKNRMYVLETVTDADKDDNSSIDRFMNSFELTN